MEIRTREEEREYLLKLIFEWNASRLDIFEISQPDEVSLQVELFTIGADDRLIQLNFRTIHYRWISWFRLQNLEYKGVMRFFFQDSGTKDTKVATKCVRVSNKDTTDDVLKVLVEKFRPDMKMLTNPEYRLYEVHPNGGKPFECYHHLKSFEWVPARHPIAEFIDALSAVVIYSLSSEFSILNVLHECYVSYDQPFPAWFQCKLPRVIIKYVGS